VACLWRWSRMACISRHHAMPDHDPHDASGSHSGGRRFFTLSLEEI
jgi:hypothetical protein